MDVLKYGWQFWRVGAHSPLKSHMLFSGTLFRGGPPSPLKSQMLFSGAFFRSRPLVFCSFIGKSLSSLLQSPLRDGPLVLCSFIGKLLSSLLQSPLTLDGRLCGTPSSIPYSPLRRSCLPLFSAFRCAKSPLTFSSTAQSCFSFLLCIHNGSTVVTIKHLWTLNVHNVYTCLFYIYLYGLKNVTPSQKWESSAFTEWRTYDNCERSEPVTRVGWRISQVYIYIYLYPWAGHLVLREPPINAQRANVRPTE